MAHESTSTHTIQNFDVYILCVLYKIIWNSVSTITRHDYRGCIDKSWGESENVRRSWKIFIANIYIYLENISMCHGDVS